MTDFYAKSNVPDGLQYWCKECIDEANKQNRKRKSGEARSEELKMYTSRQLMEELAKRGYRGELEYVKKININKL